MKKTLIAYFTRTGITQKLAEATAKQTGADLFAIEPVKTYSSTYLVCVGQAPRLKTCRTPVLRLKQSRRTCRIMTPSW